MREIKFRCYSKDLGIIIYDGDIGYQFDVSSSGTAYIYEGYREVWDFETILMQYTGLKDKNGKEIYEGDILKLELIDWCDLECDLIVIDEKSFFSDVCYLQEIDKISKQGGSLDSIEVIGNIYENPELLKGE